MRYFTYYWNGDEFSAHVSALDEGSVHLTDYTGGSGFRARGLAHGDALYLVNWLDGELSVLGRMRVDAVVDEAAARSRRGEVYSASEHVLSLPGSATPFVDDALVLDEDLDGIQFVAADGGLSGPKRNQDGKIEPQTFRNVREITEDTAELFDHLLGFPEQAAPISGVTRRISFGVFIRDDDGEQVDWVVTLESRSDRWIPRWIELDYSSPDSSLLDDDERQTEIVRDLILGWSDRSQCAVDPSELDVALNEAVEAATTPEQTE